MNVKPQSPAPAGRPTRGDDAAAGPEAQPGISVQRDPSHGDRVLTDQGRQRKQELLDAATLLFNERGFAATRISDICEKAGVAKGLFYWYFATKQDLFAELLRSTQLDLRRAQADAIDPNADPLTRIRQGTVASVKFIADHAEFFELVNAERADPAVADDLRAASRVYLADVEHLIVEAQRLALIDDRPANLLAAGVLGTVGTFTSSAQRRHAGLSDAALADFVADWVVRALGTT